MAEYIDKTALIEWLTRPTGFASQCVGCTDINCLDCIVNNAIANFEGINFDLVIDMSQQEQSE